MGPLSLAKKICKHKGMMIKLKAKRHLFREHCQYWKIAKTPYLGANKDNIWNASMLEWD